MPNISQRISLNYLESTWHLLFNVFSGGNSSVFEDFGFENVKQTEKKEKKEKLSRAESKECGNNCFT